MSQITSHTTDEELMNLYLQANVPAFEALYTRHAGKLLGYLKKKVSPEIAEELVQDVFARMHNAKHTYNENYLFLPWIFTIARNTLLDHYKKAETRVTSATEALTEENLVTPIDMSVDTAAILRALPPQQQKIFELRYLNEWSFEQISRETALSESNIRQIISRGLKVLKMKASES